MMRMAIRTVSMYYTLELKALSLQARLISLKPRSAPTSKFHQFHQSSSFRKYLSIDPGSHY